MTQQSPIDPRVLDRIPLSVPDIRGNEWAYIKECLDTNWVSSAGSFVDRFERQTAEYVGRESAVATINGTAALHVSLLVAGVEPDDEVLVSTLTFIAPANAIRYVGAWPVFMDAEPLYWQMDPVKVRDFLESHCLWSQGQLVNRSTGRRVKAILPVHILGHPCDMEPILDIARQYELTVIEDATQSLGAKYDGKMVGSLGDIASLSFNGNKLITTGGGGMIVTDNREWAQRARYLTTQAKDDPVEYVHNEIGYNYRLTNLQAAMGVAQLEQIDDFVQAKKNIASNYRECFNELEGLSTMLAQPEAEPVYWLYTILLPEGTTLQDRKSFIANLSQSGIEARPLWHPIHGLPPYLECQAHNIEVAPRLYERGVSVPCSVGLTAADQRRCITAVTECFTQLEAKSS